MASKHKGKIEKLEYKRPSAWQWLDEKKAFLFAETYINFLNSVKTEWDAVDFFVDKLKKAGFTENRGRKRYYVHKDRMLIAAKIASPNPDYLRLIIAHIDAPRLDLKQNPLYEDSSIAMFKTHYYGGIKKYHWLNIPLELHGRVFTKTGKEKRIVIGAAADEPVLVISDLLPHLSKKVVDSKKVNEAFQAENLRVLVGNRPIDFDEKTKNPVKLQILKILKEKYDISERDFLTAEFEIVPNLIARFVGLDRSMIGGYGQDDRISAFCAVNAFLASKGKGNEVLVLVDKEEIGSDGSTGAKSKVIRNVLKQFYNKSDIDMLLMKSKALSADVNSAVDPNFMSVFEVDNNSLLGYGIVLTKVTGSGGKYSASEADARFVSQVTRILDDNKVAWQIGEIGKVDEGGGGTVAKFIAEYGMDILDAGPAVLGMHSPYEVTSVADLYMTYRAYTVFYENV